MLTKTVRSSVLYTISNKDMATITIDDLKTLGDDDKEEEWERKTRMKLVLANQLRENKNACFEEISDVSC